MLTLTDHVNAARTQLIKNKIDNIYNINSFDTIRNLAKFLKNIKDKSNNMSINKNIKFLGSFNYLPKGIIAFYKGTTAPDGWGICDGTNNTPDLRGRFIVGYDATNTDYNIIGKKGGANDVILSTNQMASHNHTTPAGAHNHSYQQPTTVDCSIGFRSNEGYKISKHGSSNKWHLKGDLFGTNDMTDSGNHTHSNVGGGEKHNNLPPYYILMYIMKIL